MTKVNARKLSKIYRDNIDKGTHYIKSKIIVSKIQKDVRFQQSKVIGIYYPFGSEVDITSLVHDNAVFAYPKIINDKMEFIKFTKKTKFKMSSYGILEPIKGIIISSEIDLLLVSSLSKNNCNYRLGYGKGYYDQFIKKYQPKYKIGILFDNYTLDFNEDLWDISLDDYISN